MSSIKITQIVWYIPVLQFKELLMTFRRSLYTARWTPKAL